MIQIFTILMRFEVEIFRIYTEVKKIFEWLSIMEGIPLK